MTVIVKTYRFLFVVSVLIFCTLMFLKPASYPVCEQCNCPPSETLLNRPLARESGFKSYLEANERIRQRFYEKRRKYIYEGRDPSKIGLWEHLHGWQYVWNSFPPVFTCPHLLERIGTAKDGGKWVCGFELFEESKEPCIMYSLGVGWDSTFELEFVQRTNCEVYAFDFTVDQMTLPHSLPEEQLSRIHFYKLGIGSKSQAEEDPRFRSLQQIMEQNGHTWIDFLKMDIERSEFQVLSELAQDFPQGYPFGHLNLEVHLDEDDIDSRGIKGEHEEYKMLHDLWTILEEKGGLRPFFWEDNYYHCTFGEGSKKPVVMEYAFINVGNEQWNKLIQF